MENSNIFIRYDEARREFVVALDIVGLRTFEGSSSLLSQAILSLAEQLEEEGI